MFVSGFTIARNVVKADYPIKEAILSILPLCDEVIVAVGKSEDSTLEYIKTIDSDKIKIIETVWDDSLREGGRVLADETNKALKAVNPNANWCIYIQADECLHEKDYVHLRQMMQLYKSDDNIDKLKQNELDGHFSTSLLQEIHDEIQKISTCDSSSSFGCLRRRRWWYCGYQHPQW